MTELEESTIREYNYNENRKRMTAVHRNFKITRISNFYANLIIGFLSIASMMLWYSVTNAGIKMALRLEEDIGTISFPGQAITCIAAPVIAVLTYFADVFFIKKLNIISQIIYVCIGVFSLLNLALGFEPMHLSHMLLLIAYAVAGFYTQDFSIRNYKELDYLSKQEGFPEFLFVIESDTHSKYVKYRKKWLDQDKKLDYFSKSERPVSDFNVVASENSDHMDGISVNDNVREQWFTDMNEASSESNSAAEPASDCMDIIENFQELPAEDYIIEKISNKPL